MLNSVLTNYFSYSSPDALIQCLCNCFTPKRFMLESWNYHRLFSYCYGQNQNTTLRFDLNIWGLSKQMDVAQVGPELFLYLLSPVKLKLTYPNSPPIYSTNPTFYPLPPLCISWLQSPICQEGPCSLNVAATRIHAIATIVTEAGAVCILFVSCLFMVSTVALVTNI